MTQFTSVEQLQAAIASFRANATLEQLEELHAALDEEYTATGEAVEERQAELEAEEEARAEAEQRERDEAEAEAERQNPLIKRLEYETPYGFIWIELRKVSHHITISRQIFGGVEYYDRPGSLKLSQVLQEAQDLQRVWDYEIEGSTIWLSIGRKDYKVEITSEAIVSIGYKAARYDAAIASGFPEWGLTGGYADIKISDDQRRSDLLQCREWRSTPAAA